MCQYTVNQRESLGCVFCFGSDRSIMMPRGNENPLSSSPDSIKICRKKGRLFVPLVDQCFHASRTRPKSKHQLANGTDCMGRALKMLHVQCLHVSEPNDGRLEVHTGNTKGLQTCSCQRNSNMISSSIPWNHQSRHGIKLLVSGHPCCNANGQLA